MKRKFLPLLLTVVLVVAAAIVPMLTLTASAAETTGTISFASTAQRVSQDSSSQVWSNDGITFTNNKASSSTAVGNYSNPVRIYAGSNITFEAPGNITEIVVACSSASYATVLVNSVGSEATASGSDVTITPTSSATTYTIAKITAQTRFKSVTVTYEVAGDETCAHTNTTTTTTPATKTEDGSIVVTCVDCGYEVSEEKIPALGCNVDFVVPTGATAPSSQSGVLEVIMPAAPELVGYYAQDYTFAGWAEAAIDGDTNVRPTLYAAGEPVELTDDTTFYAVYSYEAEGDGESAGTDFELSNTIKAGDTVVITMTKGDVIYALSYSNGSSTAPSAGSTVTVNNGKITSVVSDDIKWIVGGDSNGYTFATSENANNLLYCTNANNGVRVGTNANNVFTVSGNYLMNKATSRYLGVYNTQDWRCYTTNTGSSNIANQTLSFYVLSTSSTVTHYVTNPVTSNCDHSDAEITTVDPTCTENGSITTTCDCGFTKTEVIPATGHQNTTNTTIDATCTVAGSITEICDDCGETVSTETIPANGHNYVNGTCDVCGEEQPNESTAELSFATTDNRTFIDDEHQIWQANGLVFVNNKANSTTKVANYAPVRLYKSSSITITAPGYISKIVFNCTDSDYLLNIDGAEVDGTTVTINLDATSKSFTIDALSGQVRLNSISVTYNRYPSKAVFSGASLTLGTNLAMNYFVTLPKDGVIDGYSVKFTLNGVETVVDTYTEVNGEYVFTLAGIGPQNYQDEITAELVYGGATIYTKDAYTVEASLNGYVADEDTKALAEATLAYCAAAKAYVSDEITSTEKVEGTVAETGKSITNNVKVTAVGVNFDYVNKIYVKLNDEASVKFGDNDAVNVTDGIAYSDALTALQFNDTVTIVVDNTTTVTYSVNAYAYTIYTKYVNAEDLTEKQLEMYNLAVTLYNYGAAAKAYKAN